MTIPEPSLYPPTSNDRRALLRTLELVAGVGVQLAQIRRPVIGQRVPLEPYPQIFDWVHIGHIGRQEGQLDATIQPVQILAHQFSAVRLQPTPDNQQRLLEVEFERRPSTPLPLAHCIFTAFQRTFLGVFYAETQCSKNPPKLGCAKPDTILALDGSAARRTPSSCEASVWLVCRRKKLRVTHQCRLHPTIPSMCIPFAVPRHLSRQLLSDACP